MEAEIRGVGPVNGGGHMRRSGWLWLAFGVLLFAGSFAFTYARLSPDDGRLGGSGGRLADERLVEGASLTLRYVLEDGRRGEEHRLDLPQALVGATLGDLRQREPAWSVLRFGSDELVAEVRCSPLIGEDGYLGEKEGMVAVFEGKPGGCGVLREVTNIPLGELRPEDQERIKAGMAFHSLDEWQQLLDGLVGD